MSSLRPHFQLSRLFQIRIFGWQHSVSFTFFQIFGTRWLASEREHKLFTRISWSSGRLAEGCEKSESPVEQNSSKYLRWSRWEKKIFVKYLPREGLVCQFFCFLLFSSARSNCSVHKISDLTNQPFMAFSNNSTNIQIILQKKIFGTKFWRFWTIWKRFECFWIKFEHVTRFKKKTCLFP